MDATNTDTSSIDVTKLDTTNMETTKLSSKGQVIIPKGIRAAHQWEAGLELQVIDMGDGILLRPKAPFAETALGDVAGLLKDRVRPKTDRDIQNAVAKGVRATWSKGKGRDRN